LFCDYTKAFDSLLLNSGKKFRALRDKKNYILTLVLSEQKILNETKNHNTPPPFQIKWSVPGFRPGIETVDAIFALMSIIFKSLSVKKRLYCCFVIILKPLILFKG
jgi:hypothetical protein